MPSTLPALAGLEDSRINHIDPNLQEAEHLIESIQHRVDKTVTENKLGGELRSKLPGIRKKNVAFEISSELPPR